MVVHAGRTGHGTRAAAARPADPVYDPFWARVTEAGITVAYHSGEAGYGRYMVDWGESAEFESFRRTPLYGVLTSDRAITDTMAALICHGLFDRFPRPAHRHDRERFSEWVPAAEEAAQVVLADARRRSAASIRCETFRDHVWVAPYYEDDIRGLADAIGADHVLFGSDWPHAEGLAEPTDFVDDLKGFTDDEVRLIMRENALRSVATSRELSLPAASRSRN